MEKVKVSREIAELMVNIKRDILIDIPYMQRMAIGEYPDTEQLSPMYDWYLDNKEAYFKALTIGYEVEQTPEDKVRDYYRTVQGFFPNSHAAQEADAIVNTLNLLNIKIPGVNV